MIRISRFTLIASMILCQVATEEAYSQQTKWSPEQVYYGVGGKLAYTPDDQGNVIPDFSHVGYRYGDESIPDVPTVVEVNPVEGDNRTNIQAAIDQVAAMSPDANGFKGAVLLKKGIYMVSGQLFIRSGGVVLRGEGMTDEGTVLFATGNGKRDFIVIGNGNGRSNLNSKVNIIEDYVPLGRKFVVVDNASTYNEGDHIALYRPGTSNWISDLRMDQIPNPNGSTKQWTPSSYSFYFERKVTKVVGDTIYFRNPVVMAMEKKYGGGSVYKCTSDRIQKVGVEDLCMKSTYKHDTDEDHAWTAIAFNSIEHGWARRVTSWYFGYACTSILGKARLISVEDCHCRDPKSQRAGGRRYSFNISGSLCLIKGCTADLGRHDFATGSRVCGPNVFSNCSATNASTDIGPHHRWAMGTLYEVIETNSTINVQDRGDSGTGHGWAGANQVFWNCKASSSVCQSPWVSAKNYSFGFIGVKDHGRYPRPDGVWVGHNRPGIFPESLYQAQLDSRLNDEGVFSVFPDLEKINDSTFILSFTLPYLPLLASPNSFSISGNAGYEGAEFSVIAVSDTSIGVGLDGIGPLPAFSSVIVNVDNMLSAAGKPLKGLTYARYIEPDLRPVVTGLSTRVNNEDGMLEASSSKPGSIYLIKFSEDYNYLDLYRSESDLDQAVTDNLGRKVDAPLANATVSIAAEGLPGGYYFYLALDEEGRVSEPADEWPEVEATGPVWGQEDTVSVNQIKYCFPGFSVWAAKGRVFIEPDDPSSSYSARIFDITGRLLDVREKMQGEQQYPLPEISGILILRLTSERGLHILSYKLLNTPSR